MSRYLIVGGGISGLLAAFLLKKKNPTNEVVVVEKDIEFGGLLKSFQYSPNQGVFDYGIHTIYDSGNDDLDNIIRSFLPENEWIQLKGVKRDYGGTYFNGVLQSNSAYIDVRNFSEEDLSNFIEGFFSNINKGEKRGSAFEYLKSKYGEEITSGVFSKIIDKIYPFSIENTHDFVTKLLPLERIVMFDKETMESLNKSSTLRASLAYPDQLEIPKNLIPKKSAWYPKQYGMSRFVNRVIEKLEDLEVELSLDSIVTNLEIGEGNSTLTIEERGKKKTYKNIDKVIWTSGITSCYYTLFGAEAEKFDFDRPVRTCFVNFGLAERPRVKDLFYIYCLEPGFITHRLSCPSSFCPQSYADGIFRLTAEVILKNELSDSEIEKKVIQELEVMDILNAEDVNFVNVERISGGYPTISLKNVQALERMRENIKDRYGTVVELHGAMSQPDLFFQTDILKNLYQSII